MNLKLVLIEPLTGKMWNHELVKCSTENGKTLNYKMVKYWTIKWMSLHFENKGKFRAGPLFKGRIRNITNTQAGCRDTNLTFCIDSVLTIRQPDESLNFKAAYWENLELFLLIESWKFPLFDETWKHFQCWAIQKILWKLRKILWVIKLFCTIEWFNLS